MHAFLLTLMVCAHGAVGENPPVPQGGCFKGEWSGDEYNNIDYPSGDPWYTDVKFKFAGDGTGTFLRDHTLQLLQQVFCDDLVFFGRILWQKDSKTDMETNIHCSLGDDKSILCTYKPAHAYIEFITVAKPTATSLAELGEPAPAATMCLSGKFNGLEFLSPPGQPVGNSDPPTLEHDDAYVQLGDTYFSGVTGQLNSLHEHECGSTWWYGTIEWGDDHHVSQFHCSQWNLNGAAPSLVCSFATDKTREFYFTSGSSGWLPIGSWERVACHWGGSITWEVEQSVEYEHQVSVELSESISESITSSAEFKGVGEKTELSWSTTSSISKSWKKSYTTQTTLTVPCTTNEDGTDWNGGCLWQFQMSMTRGHNEALSWNAPITRCTSSEKGEENPPLCPPFEPVVDGHCNSSVMVDGSPRISSSSPKNQLRGTRTPRMKP